LKIDRHNKNNDGGIHLVIGPTTFFFYLSPNCNKWKKNYK